MSAHPEIQTQLPAQEDARPGQGALLDSRAEIYPGDTQSETDPHTDPDSDSGTERVLWTQLQDRIERRTRRRRRMDGSAWTQYEYQASCLRATETQMLDDAISRAGQASTAFSSYSHTGMLSPSRTPSLGRNHTINHSEGRISTHTSPPTNALTNTPTPTHTNTHTDTATLTPATLVGPTNRDADADANTLGEIVWATRTDRGPGSGPEYTSTLRGLYEKYGVPYGEEDVRVMDAVSDAVADANADD